VKDEYIRDQGAQQGELFEKKKQIKTSKYEVLIGKVKVMDPEPRQVLRARRLLCLQLRERPG